MQETQRAGLFAVNADSLVTVAKKLVVCPFTCNTYNMYIIAVESDHHVIQLHKLCTFRKIRVDWITEILACCLSVNVNVMYST